MLSIYVHKMYLLSFVELSMDLYCLTILMYHAIVTILRNLSVNLLYIICQIIFILLLLYCKLFYVMVEIN